jgi:hypothetical protein
LYSNGAFHTNFNLGVEYWFKEILAIRVGYKTLTKDELKSSDLTFGAGFRLPGTGIGLDYAYCDYNDLGNTHRISLLLKMPTEPVEKEITQKEVDVVKKLPPVKKEITPKLRNHHKLSHQDITQLRHQSYGWEYIFILILRVFLDLMFG